MNHKFLSDQQLNEIEERYKSLQKLVTIDVGALLQEVREYKQITDVSPNRHSTIDWDKLPMTLRPKHIQDILGISQRKIYELLHKSPFYIVKDGQQIYISKNVFRTWLEGTN